MSTALSSEFVRLLPLRPEETLSSRQIRSHILFDHSGPHSLSIGLLDAGLPYIVTACPSAYGHVLSVSQQESAFSMPRD
jgi:hypothetical protein